MRNWKLQMIILSVAGLCIFGNTAMKDVNASEVVYTDDDVSISAAVDRYLASGETFEEEVVETAEGTTSKPKKEKPATTQTATKPAQTNTQATTQTTTQTNTQANTQTSTQTNTQTATTTTTTTTAPATQPEPTVEETPAETTEATTEAAPEETTEAPAAPAVGPNPRGGEIASYGLQFVGNPYVYGGTSLTNGADCSGFVMSVYAAFGVSLPRTAGQQANYGVEIPVSEAQAGDLIFYGDGAGGIGHVALCTGPGTIVHASTYSTGIISASMYYRTPVKAVRVLY